MNKAKFFLATVGVSLAMAFIFSCSLGDDDISNPPIGSSKGKTVKINTQTWMTENLDYALEGSRCYDDDPENCAKYGRLYNWATAMAIPVSCNSISCASQINAKHRGICPEGWHIPSNDDWDALYDFVGAGVRLKAARGWNEGGNGLDAYGFAALPGGGYSSFLGNFGDVGSAGFWWSANEYNSEGAYGRFMSLSYEDAREYSNYKSHMFSVRCIQD